MLRVHIIMILALAQAVYGERLMVHLNTGGRGYVQITNLLDPWVTIALVMVPFRKALGRALWTKQALLFFLPFLFLSTVLPALGIAFMGYPVRTIYSSWNAIIPFSFLTIGIAGAMELPRGGAKAVRGWFMFGVITQTGLAFIQALDQFERVPSFLKPIATWDLKFKEEFNPDNVVLGRSTGFYTNPNSLGIFALLVFWTSFFLLKGWQRLVGCVAGVFLVFLCQSRGTLASLLASVGIYAIAWLLFRADRMGRLKATLVAVICMIPLVVVVVPGLLASVADSLHSIPFLGTALDRYVSGAKVLSEGAGADSNFKGRTQYWVAAYEYLAVHPFGSLGPSEMMVLVPPDNQYVGAMEQGSFFLFGALLGVFWGGIRLLNRAAPISRVVAMACIALAVNSISAVPFGYPASFLFWLLVGAHLAHGHARPFEEDYA